MRQALANLFDVDDLLETEYDGLGMRTNGLIYPGKDYSNNDLPLIKYNVDKAVNLLKEAGWEDSNNNGIVDKVINGEVTEMSLDLLSLPNIAFNESLALLFKDGAKKGGVEINIVYKDPRAKRQAVIARDYELSTGGFVREPNILDDLRQIYHTSHNTATPDGLNRTGFGNAKTDALLEAIVTELDKNKRDQLYKEIQEVIYEEQNHIFLFIPRERILLKNGYTVDFSAKKMNYYIPHIRPKK